MSAARNLTDPVKLLAAGSQRKRRTPARRSASRGHHHQQQQQLILIFVVFFSSLLVSISAAQELLPRDGSSNDHWPAAASTLLPRQANSRPLVTTNREESERSLSDGKHQKHQQQQQQFSFTKTEQRHSKSETINQDQDIDQAGKQRRVTSDLGLDEQLSLRQKRSLSQLSFDDFDALEQRKTRPPLATLETDLGQQQELQRVFRGRRRSLSPLPEMGLLEQKATDCKKLIVFWTFLQSSYPSLANHLFSLSMEQSDGGNAQQLISKLAQNSKAIMRLLEQADKLLQIRAAQQEGSPRSPLATAASKWISKVVSNPTYSKLLNRLNQQQRLFSERMLANQQAPIVSGAATTIAPSPTQTMTASLSADNENNVYGRIVHYPQDLDRSAGASSNLNDGNVLDKLHQLNHFVRASEDSTSDDHYEDNKIPQVSSGSSSKENKFVYGSILHRPSQKGDINSVRQQHHFSNDYPREQQVASDAHQQRNSNLQQSNESFGRILISPPGSFANQQQQNINNDNSGQRQSTLGRLQQQLDSLRLLETSAEQQAHDPNERNEFEGTFHSGPLEHVVITQHLPRGNEAEVLVHTTSSSKNVFDIGD